MREFTSDEIQSQFEKLSPELQAAVTSPEINDKIQQIGMRHNLMIDQVGELVDQIGLVMFGLEKASNFVKDSSERLSISAKEAQLIAEDINSEIFSALKFNMRKTEERVTEMNKNITGIPAIEAAGNFTIEKQKRTIDTAKETVQTDKESILYAIENPESIGKKENNSATPEHETFTEPLSDQLLDAPPSNPEKKPKGPDMYREPLE